MVELEFHNPSETDFHAVRMLLTEDYLDGQPFHVSGAADLIIAQTRVGTTVHPPQSTHDSPPTTDPVGFITAVNMQRHWDVECIGQVRNHLLKKCPKQGKMREALEQALRSPTTADTAKKKGKKQTNKKGKQAAAAGGGGGYTGLILSERYQNLPPQCAPWLQKALFDEIEWATEDEPTAELRDSYRFSQYLIITTVMTQVAEADDDEDGDDNDSYGGGGQATKKKKKKKKTKTKFTAHGGQADDSTITYRKLEDEVYHRACGGNCFRSASHPPLSPQTSSTLRTVRAGTSCRVVVRARRWHQDGSDW